MSNKLTVVGSSNIDLVVKTSRIPSLGETILGKEFFMVPGGKGANQAVAAAKLGSEVLFVAKLGKDLYGQLSKDNFKKVGVCTDCIGYAEQVSSGIATITIDDQGNNVIVVVPGANNELSVSDVESSYDRAKGSKAVVAQLEIPIDTVMAAGRLASLLGVPFILDPAPAAVLPQEIYEYVSIIKPNETEASFLTGVDVVDEASAIEASKCLRSQGVEVVIITLGSKGLVVNDKNDIYHIPAFKVAAVDSTAAGDAFTGALAHMLASGSNLFDSCKFASKVSAFSVTRYGAQVSMPSMADISNFIFTL